MILFINGSPKPNSNLRRMLEKIGNDTGVDYKIIDLMKLDIRPCLGCSKCVKTNRCIQKDDMSSLYDRIVTSDALVIGGVTYFAHPNALTRTFMERMFPLRHRHPQTLGKLGAAVAVGAEHAEQTAQEIAYHMEAYFNFKMVGTVFFKSETWCCHTCGYGTTCKYGGPALTNTPEWFEAFKEITPEMIKVFEDNVYVCNACKKLSQDLKTAIDEENEKKTKGVLQA